MGAGPIALPLLALVVYRTSQPGRSVVDGLPTDNSGPRYTFLFGEWWFWNIFCGFIGGAAMWALTEALLNAWNSGFVSLPGRRGHGRPMVPWAHAWAYLLGLVFIATGALGSRCLRRDSQWYPLYGLAAVAIVVIGYVSVLFSEIFSSLSKTLFFVGLMAGVVLVLWVNREFGRRAAVAAWISCLCLAFYAAGVR